MDVSAERLIRIVTNVIGAAFAVLFAQASIKSNGASFRSFGSRTTPFIIEAVPFLARRRTAVVTAFVLSGGASLGAAQAGMLAALSEAGVRPDLVVGTSVGAINGAWVAGGVDCDGLGAVWRSLRRDRVFPARAVDGLLGFVGRREHVVPDIGIRRLLREHVRFARLEDAPVPFHVVATDVLTGCDTLLSHGEAVDAILASAAIPGVLPPVRVAGRYLMDGGVVNNTPISHAVRLGADVIWVLATGYSCALAERPRGALGMALHAVTLGINRRLAADIRRYTRRADLRVVPPLCPIKTAAADFSKAAELIERAHGLTRDWLAAGAPQLASAATKLAPHGHAVGPDGLSAATGRAGRGHAEVQSA